MDGFGGLFRGGGGGGFRLQVVNCPSQVRGGHASVKVFLGNWFCLFTVMCEIIILITCRI